MPIDSTNLFSRCLPAIGTDVARCGAITACNVRQVTSSDLASIYGTTDAAGSSQYRVLGNMIAADFMGKAVGVRSNGMYDFLKANTKVLDPKKVGVSKINGGLWEISPFVKMGRKRNQNTEFWTVRVPGGTGATPSQTANLTVRIYSQGSLGADARWFPTGMRVFVRGSNAATGSPAAGDTVYTLAFSVSSISGTGSDNNGAYVTAVLTPQNTASNFASSGTAAIQNKAKIPANLAAESSGNGGALLGLLVRGTANVNDYESYCDQIPGLNPNQLLPFWIETTRYSVCQDELTQKYLTLLRENNPFFKEFGDVESVELSKQITEDFQRRWANSVFFNKPLPNQTLANWQSLSQITTPSIAGLNISGAEGRCIGYKANATGLYEQLAECSRVQDLEAETLNLRRLFNTLYQLKRQREAAGGKADIIELYTDTFYAKGFIGGMVDYFKSIYGNDVFRLTAQLNTGGKEGPFGFRYYSFELDYPQVELRIVTHPFFDDVQAAHQAAGFGNAGRMLWAIDWSNVYTGIIDSNTVVNKSGELSDLAKVDDTYMCVMKVPTREQRLTSTTFTTVLEAETTSFVIENLAVTKPDGTTDPGSVTYANF